MALSKILSGAIFGIDAFCVEVETDAGMAGDPQIVIVGLPDAAVRESQYRVSSAVSNCGYEPFRGRITVNLAPADIRKEGPFFDLPIAMGILVASGALEQDSGTRRRKPGQPPPRDLTPMDIADVAMIGELSLAGEVRRVRGVLPIAMKLKESGITTFLVPEENAAEAAVVESVKAASEVYAPVSGEVIEINNALERQPGLVNTDPIGAGWFFKIKLSNPVELEGLMEEPAYQLLTRQGH